jgi:hypothetical protein
MTIAGISTAVHTILEDSNKFVTVLDHAPEQENDFEGYPSVSHYYQGTQADYATVSQNRRLVEYTIELYLVTNASDNSTQLSEMYTLADEVIDLFDKSIDINDACDLMRPAPGQLYRRSTKEGMGYAFTIQLFCESDIAFR